jgi:dimeric dUTPase (all-alpha-NTP-PPase superfamily)
MNYPPFHVIYVNRIQNRSLKYPIVIVYSDYMPVGTVLERNTNDIERKSAQLKHIQSKYQRPETV